MNPQSDRITYERVILSQRLPQYQFSWIRQDIVVHGWYTANSGRRFELQLLLGPYYPHAIPTMVLLTPHTVPLRPSGTLNELGTSHAFHTGPTTHDGRVTLCFTNHWDASISCVLIFLRAMVWCEGYCAHCSTGQPISDYVRNDEH